MSDSFEEMFNKKMQEFEKAARDHAARKKAERRRAAIRRKLEKGTLPLPLDKEGRIYDARNDKDREEAIEKIIKAKNTIRDMN